MKSVRSLILLGVFFWLISITCKHALRQYEQPLFFNSSTHMFSGLAHEDRKKALSRLCGFKNVAADLYWLHFLQQDHLGKKLPAEHLFACADLITDLDPFFNVVYRFAAIGLTVGLHRPDLANKLLKKSLRAGEMNGDDWLIYFYLGHNYHFYLNDNKKAARYIQSAAQQPKTFDSLFKVDRSAPPDYLHRWAQRLADF